MGNKISLSIYSLCVIGEKSDRLFLDKLNDNDSLIDIFYQYIKDNKNMYSQDSSKETLFQFSEVELYEKKNLEDQTEYQILYGRVKTGEYGIESELVNIHTREVTTRTIEQANMMPFGFCVAVPAGKVDRALIMFQTMGAYGVKVALQKHLQKCLLSIGPEFHLVIKSIIPKEYIDRYFKEGVLKKIRMIRYDIPQEITNRIGINYGVKQTKEERIIHRPVGFLERNKKKIEEWRKGQRSYSNIIEIDGFDYDDLKFEFSLGETEKTFNLSDLEKIVMTEDITKKVQLDGGHPIFESLKPVFRDYAEKYLKDMGFLIK